MSSVYCPILLARSFDQLCRNCQRIIHVLLLFLGQGSFKIHPEHPSVGHLLGRLISRAELSYTNVLSKQAQGTMISSANLLGKTKMNRAWHCYYNTRCVFLQKQHVLVCNWDASVHHLHSPSAASKQDVQSLAKILGFGLLSQASTWNCSQALTNFC